MIELKDEGQGTRWAHIFYVDMENETSRDAAMKEGLITKRMEKLAQRLTIAKIYPSIQSRLNGEAPLSVGVAACSKKDNFSKHLGRTIAIGRALKQLEKNDQEQEKNDQEQELSEDEILDILNQFYADINKGEVTLYTDCVDDDGREVACGRMITPEELDKIGFTESYVDDHPEGSDRGGYVPYLEASGHTFFYYENAGEWSVAW